MYDSAEEDADSLLGVFCGKRFPWNLRSTGSHIFMRLIGVEWRKNVDVVNLHFDSIGINIFMFYI